MSNQQTTQNLSIRHANQDDVPTIFTFIHELAEYEKLAYQVIATEDSLRKSLFGNHPMAEILLAEYSEIPIGFALFFHNYSTFLGQPGIYLEDLYIKPSYRGQGIGRALLAHIGEIAKQRDCGRVEWSVLNWNEDAIRFYQNLGATPLNDWTVFRITGADLDKLAISSNCNRKQQDT